MTLSAERRAKLEGETIGVMHALAGQPGALLRVRQGLEEEIRTRMTANGERLSPDDIDRKSVILATMVKINEALIPIDGEPWFENFPRS